MEFDILQVAERLGLAPIKSGPGSEIIFRCPFCGDSEKHPGKGHFYVNASSTQFKCHRCFEEGNAVTLWARLRKVDTKTAYRELREISVETHRPERRPVIDVHRRDEVYAKLLDVLHLSSGHKEDLLRRGLNEPELATKGYRTVPQETKARWKITRGLLEKGISLEGIPGFFTRNGRYGDFWDFVSPRGYFVPVRDVQGRIQALKIKLDEGGYLWFSSNGLPHGTTSNAPAHYAGGGGAVWITEGPLKADVAASLTGNSFIGVPGVGAWREANGFLKELGVKTPVIAFDADQRSNPHVAKALEAFITNLRAGGFVPQNCTWPDLYGKGIDDVMLRLVKSEVSSVVFFLDGRRFEVKRAVTTTVSVK